MNERADIQNDELLNCRQTSRALRLGIDDLKRMRLSRSGPPYITQKGSVAYRRSDLEAWAASVRPNVHP